MQNQTLTDEALEIIRRRSTGEDSSPTLATVFDDRRALLGHVDALTSALEASARAEEASRRKVAAVEHAAVADRVVTTQEELDALGVQSIVLDDDGDVMHKVWGVPRGRDDFWAHMGSDGASVVCLPAVVLLDEPGRAVPCQTWSAAGRRRRTEVSPPVR